VKASHSVTVLGREISVRSTAPAARVQEVEAFVNTRLQEVGAGLKSGDAQLVLTLALLNTTEELLVLRKAHEAHASLEDRLREMLRKLEAV
jgi:cell division protein ZapA